MGDNTRIIAENQEQEISLKDTLLKLREWGKHLLSKWYIIVAFGILGAILGFFYAFSKKPVYTATTTFVLESGSSSSNLGQYSGVASMFGIDLNGSAGGLFQGENILQLYRSRSMIKRVLLTTVDFQGQNQLLIDRYLDASGLRKNWLHNAELRNIQFVKAGVYNSPKEQLLHDSIMGIVVKDINQNYLSVAKPDRKMNIIEVKVQSKDELFAKIFNEQIVQNVNDFYLQTKTKKSIDNITILQHKTDSVRALMTGAIYRAANVADATPNLNPTRQVQRIAPIETAHASAEVNKAILGQLVQNLELGKIALQKETPLIQVVDQPVLPLDKESVSKIKTLILWGIVFALLTSIIILTIRVFKNILSS